LIKTSIVKRVELIEVKSPSAARVARIKGARKSLIVRSFF